VKETSLTPLEEVIYKVLVAADGEVVPTVIIEQLRAPAPPPPKFPGNRVAVHIKNLRIKTGLNIKAVRGVGYKIIS
jgi:DNA-binding response OmpR family regulator